MRRAWRVVAIATGALVAAPAILATTMRAMPDDPSVWHADPLTAPRSDSPNDYLVAPEGATAAPPDRIAEVHPVPPHDLLHLFDAVATNAGRTRRIAGSPDEDRVTYVQRSAVFGFPDYVTATAVEVPGGSALVVWSRSRFGRSDLGVNRARVEDWLAKIESPSG